MKIHREGSQGSEAASLDLRDIISQEELAMKRFKVLVNQHHNEKMQSIVKLMQESSEVPIPSSCILLFGLARLYGNLPFL